MIPHQVEFQPGPQGKKFVGFLVHIVMGSQQLIVKKDLILKDWFKILNDIADGGVKKVTFAGWATDPLNSKSIDDLLETAIKRKMIFGFNTKPIKVSEKFIKLLKNQDIKRESWISLSIDSVLTKYLTKFME